MQYSDLVQFNSEWMRALMQGNFPVSMISNLPKVGSETDRKMQIVENMSRCFARSALSTTELGAILRSSPTTEQARMTTAAAPVTLSGARLVREWLFLARLTAKDILAGKYLSLLHMHMEWADASFFANLSNDEIQTLAVRVSSSRLPMLQWAWPHRMFDITESMPESLDRLWTFSFSV
jgi:hypothetical protein